MPSVLQLRTGQQALIARVCAGSEGVVGAGGVEPPSSSVSANGGEALCGSPFAQVTADRRWRSYAFSLAGQGGRLQVATPMRWRGGRAGTVTARMDQGLLVGSSAMRSRPVA